MSTCGTAGALNCALKACSILGTRWYARSSRCSYFFEYDVFIDNHGCRACASCLRAAILDPVLTLSPRLVGEKTKAVIINTPK